MDGVFDKAKRLDCSLFAHVIMKYEEKITLSDFSNEELMDYDGIGMKKFFELHQSSGRPDTFTDLLYYKLQHRYYYTSRSPLKLSGYKYYHFKGVPLSNSNVKGIKHYNEKKYKEYYEHQKYYPEKFMENPKLNLYLLRRMQRRILL